MKLSGNQILLIDDDEILVKLLTRILNTAGYEVDSASNVKDAILKLNSTTPDLIILDLTMPEHSGFAFLHYRRQNKLLSSIPVIVLSGTTNKADIQRALEMGADQFLEKPPETRIILQKIKYIFSSKTNFVYRCPESDRPSVDAEIQGMIIEQCVGRLKIESQVKFCAGKSVQFKSEDYLSKEGTTLVCRIDNRFTELHEGFFITVLSATGLEIEAKKHFETWQRSLSE